MRLLAALYLGNEVEALPGIHDQVSYHTLALRVLGGYGFSFATAWWPMTAANAPTAHWSYLYTFYLTAVYTLFNTTPLIARLIQAIIVGLCHPWLVYKIGRLAFNETVGLVAAGLTAVYLYFIYYAAALMTEAFYITGILASLYLLMRLAKASKEEETRLTLLLGLALGGTILLRQLFLLLVPFLLAWLWWARIQNGRKMSFHMPVAIIALIALLILPFSLYNTQRFGHFVLLNTNAGYAFFLANHPIYGTHFEPILPPEMGSYQELIPTELRHLDEAALERELMSRGLQFVLADPLRYLQLSLSRIPAYFMFWPSADSGLISNVSRVASFGLLWPFMLYGLIQAFYQNNWHTIWQQPFFLLALFALLYTGIHLLSWSLVRYRLPVDGVLLIFAGTAVVHISQCLLAANKRLQVPVSQ
ncbi:MAG: glycosyltransferase family 39 protein [Anaerolineales bacterium]|nr:glycosyltransferase family 39 protein [Anaerolineales bacterium]